MWESEDEPRVLHTIGKLIFPWKTNNCSQGRWQRQVSFWSGEGSGAFREFMSLWSCARHLTKAWQALYVFFSFLLLERPLKVIWSITETLRCSTCLWGLWDQRNKTSHLEPLKRFAAGTSHQFCCISTDLVWVYPKILNPTAVVPDLMLCPSGRWLDVS